MTIEEFIIRYLNTELSGVSASGDAPTPKPERFVTVEKTGERITNYIPNATVVVQSWAKTRADAMELNETVKGKMLAMINEKEIMRCKLNSEYNYPFEASKHPRYQSVFEIVYDYNITTV